ncbi:MAG: hypothetical protein ACI9Z3_001005, partial [Roseivirga sp.]
KCSPFALWQQSWPFCSFLINALDVHLKIGTHYK